jgi:hypothetical protein
VTGGVGQFQWSVCVLIRKLLERVIETWARRVGVRGGALFGTQS